MITVGSKVKVEKGCKAREIAKGTSAKIIAIDELGAECSHQVRVVMSMLNGFLAGKTICFYARHKNRLSDSLVNLNDGNPLHKITIREVL